MTLQQYYFVHLWTGGKHSQLIDSLTHHCQVPLPDGATGALTGRTGSLEGVATALGAIKGDMVVRPGDAAGETACHLEAELLYR